jgi:hypothetical protein
MKSLLCALFRLYSSLILNESSHANQARERCMGIAVVQSNSANTIIQKHMGHDHFGRKISIKASDLEHNR